MAGRLLIIAGVGLVLLGLIFPLFGHLPGDMEFTRGRVRFFIPLGSCLLISVLITALLTTVMWFWKR